MSGVQERVLEAYKSRFGNSPQYVVRAPGRVNVIGEHTDYNDGFVLPLAIERAVWIALSPHEETNVVLHSLDFNETGEFELRMGPERDKGWLEYPKGMSVMLRNDGYALKGWHGVVSGDVPIGAGLSSSAALEMATARAFCAVSGFEWEGPRMALLGQQAENEWVGVNCGIMDQMISASGKKDHALLIDCRTLELEYVPLPEDTKVVILDTSTRRGLVGSAYNERRKQCEDAAGYFGVKALRDVTANLFRDRSKELDPITRKRANHVVTENERTLQAAKAMKSQDPTGLGKLMAASHASLRDDYEVSSSALDTMVQCASEEEACYGARMTGAGFGGCAVALVKASAAESFADSVAKKYRSRTQQDPKVYVTAATNGAVQVS